MNQPDLLAALEPVIDILEQLGVRYQIVALDRAREETLIDEPNARSFRIATPEDVVLSKMCRYRLGGEVSETQWADILGVIRVQGGALDDLYLDQWAEELDVADLLRRAKEAAA